MKEWRIGVADDQGTSECRVLDLSPIGRLLRRTLLISGLLPLMIQMSRRLQALSAFGVSKTCMCLFDL